MDINFLNDSMRVLVEFFSQGYARILDPVRLIARYLLLFDLLFFFAFMALGRGRAFGAAFEKLLYISVVLWFIGNWPMLCRELANLFIYLGLMAGGNVMSVGEFLNPARLLAKGFELSKPLLFSGNLWNPVVSAVNIGLGILLLAVFACLGLTIFVSILQLYVGIPMTGCLLPFGFLRATTPWAANAFGWVFSASVRLGTFAFVMSGVSGVISKIMLPSDPTWPAVLTTIVISVGLLLLVIRAPTIAMNLLSGGPILTGGSLAQSTAVAGGATMAVASGGVGAAIGGARLLTTGAVAARAAVQQGGSRALLGLPASYLSSMRTVQRTQQTVGAWRSRGQQLGARAANPAAPAAVSLPGQAPHWIQGFRKATRGLYDQGGSGRGMGGPRL